MSVQFISSESTIIKQTVTPRAHQFVAGVFVMMSSELNILLSEFTDHFTFFFRRLPDDLAGDPHDDAVVRHDHAFGDQSPGGDQAMSADLGSAEQNCAHADQGVVSDPSAVDDRAMTDDDVFTDVVGDAVIAVNQRVFLEVGSFSDGDGGDVTPDHRPVPQAHVLGDGDPAHHTGGIPHVHALNPFHTHTDILAERRVNGVCESAGLSGMEQAL